MARGPHWRRTSRGFYVPGEVEQSLEQRVVEASVVLPENGGVTGWAALRWVGGVWFDGFEGDGVTSLPVDLATCYQDIRSQSGFVVHQERLQYHELVGWEGLMLTTPPRSLCFVMRYAPGLSDAVVAFDMAAYSDLVSLAEARNFHALVPGWTGIPQARTALLLCDENSWSPWETRMRLVWVLDAGFPPPLSNRPVFDRNGRFLATPDLLDPESGTFGEYDGSLHLVTKQRRADVRRMDVLRDHGLESFTAVAGDVGSRSLVDRMVRARARAKWEAESQRSWTIIPPAWWTPTHSVALRRGLPLDHRALRTRLTVA